MAVKPFIIGITGGSGSGKTTLIRSLRSHFSQEELCIISQDDYYKPRELQEEDSRSKRNFDRPESIYAEELLRDIHRLKEGESFSRSSYTFNNEKARSEELWFYPAPLLVIEGLFVLHYDFLREVMDLKVFVHAKENLKIIRRIKRDRAERNYPLEDVLYRYEKHVLPAYERYIEPYREEADIVINNNETFDHGLKVLTGFCRYLLDTARQ